VISVEMIGVYAAVIVVRDMIDVNVYGVICVGYYVMRIFMNVRKRRRTIVHAVLKR
jgi:hypothetical protein